LFAFSSQTTNLARLRFVKFIGGEPFVRKDVVLRATEFCIHEGILVSYDTNLTLIDENDIKFLRELGNVKRVSVSLDYANADRIDEFRRYPGAYNTVVKNIKL
jgi:MoaA/NifB/PqqE/SkfB family radical SAM enzyme